MIIINIFRIIKNRIINYISYRKNIKKFRKQDPFIYE